MRETSLTEFMNKDSVSNRLIMPVRGLMRIFRKQPKSQHSPSPKEILLIPMRGDATPAAYVDSFEGADVPFDREEWRDRTLRLVARRSIAQAGDIN